MKVKKIITQNSKYFLAIYECEHCGQTQKDKGFSDECFYLNTLPQMKCESCLRSTEETITF